MRIIITGTESTGKTTLAEELSRSLNLSLVPDVSREWIAALNRPYTKKDVLDIAAEIIRREDEMAVDNTIYISDNDLINIKIWLKYYKWEVPDWLEARIQQNISSFYLLCYIDTPWIEDEQRANPHDRLQLYNAFVEELEQLKLPHKVLKGSPLERFEVAQNVTEKFL